MTEKNPEAGSPIRPFDFGTPAQFVSDFFGSKVNSCPVHPDAPAGGGGPGKFKSPLLLGLYPEMDRWFAPAARGQPDKVAPSKLAIKGQIVAGGEFSNSTIERVNAAAEKTPSQWRRYVGYATSVKVGGSLAWRANNPGNLRDAATKIGLVPGQVGSFAVFETLEIGRAAQRNLYLTKYGAMTVAKAIEKLTPDSENDTQKYLANLKRAGVDLDKDVKSQIDNLMPAIEANEGLILGIEVSRLP